MSKTLINFWLDTLLLVSFMAVLFGAAVVRFVFPSPAATAVGWTLWGWGFDHWLSFLITATSLFALAILVHVMLHWTWICGVISTKLRRRKTQMDDGTRTLYGVGTLIVVVHVIGLGIAAAVLTIQRPPL